MYNYITNPYTGEKVSIYNKLGKDIITNYLVYNKYGGAVDEPPAVEPPAVEPPVDEPAALDRGQEMTIQEIRAATLDRDIEICGEIRDGKFIYHNTGVNDETENRGLCQLPAHYEEGEWHTHAHTHRFYPSNEDFHKVMYNINKKSIIFTRYGYWTLECPDQIPQDRAENQSKNDYITMTNDWFATKYTINGNGYQPTENINFGEYVDKINGGIFRIVYRVACNITWTPYN